MSRARAAVAAAVLGATSVLGGAVPASATDPSVNEPGVPDPRNVATESSGFGALSTTFEGAVVDNALFQLGVNPEGHMNLPDAGPPSAGSGTTTVGLRYLPENHEVLAPGCLCEGWGVADRTTGVSGWASEDYGVSSNLTVVDFWATELASGTDVARSVVEVGNVFRVTHDFAPSPYSLNLYEILVTVENISPAPVELVYRRKMDWDVEPTHFNEYVTIGGASDFLEFSSNDGFADPDPLQPPTDIRHTGTFVDAGPDDHGALFDFAFGTLAPGSTRQFQLFYGASPNEEDAIRAVDDVAADVWSFGQPNVSDGPDADTLLDGKEQGKPNTFIFAFASPDQCDEESLVTLPPTAGGRVSVEYDPRFAAPDADLQQEEWSRRIAEEMQDRADATLDEYEALGFSVDDTTIALRIECSNITGRNAFVESSSLIHFKSHALRTWFADRIRVARRVVSTGGTLPDRGFTGLEPSPTREWVNVLDHELAHTWQYIEVVPEFPVPFWLDYFTGNQPIIESTAVLSQDLVSDADDLDPFANGDNPYPHSYMQFAAEFMSGPEAITAMGGSEYRKAAIVQYWAERWAQPTETDLERRAALFARDLVAPFTTGTAAMNSALSSCGGGCPDLYSALKDFYIAAYAQTAPNVTGADNAAFELLDSHFDRDGTAGRGQTYPRIVPFASDPVSSGGSRDYLGQSMVATEGRVYEIEIGPNISEVDVELTMTDSGVGQGLVWAAVPFGADGSANFAEAVLTPNLSQPYAVQVTSGGRLIVVVVASQPLVPWDDEAVFTLEVDAPAIISSMSAASAAEQSYPDTLVTTLASGEGILVLAAPRDGRLVTIHAYPSDPSAAVTVRRLAESGAEVTLGTFTGGATFDDGPLTAGRYLYEATAEIGGTPVTVYSQVTSVSDDVTPPRAWLELAGRAAETNDPSVRAFIGGLSEPVTDMRLALNEADLDTTAWVPFQAFSTVGLSDGDGDYHVFAQVRDAGGLESEVMIGKILLDTVAPESTAGPLSATTTTPDMSVPFTASDAATFVQYVELWLRHRPDSSADWGLWTMATRASVSPVPISLPFGEGLYEFYTIAIDGAGNREAPPTVADATTQFVTSDPALLAADTFERSVVTGWGTPDLGGPYSVTAASDFAVAGGMGTITPSTINAFKSARLLGVAAQDVDLTLRVSTDRLAAGGDQNAYVELRHLDTTNFYRLRLSLQPDADVSLEWDKVAGGVTSTLAAETEVAGLTHAANAWFNLRVQASGTDPTSLRAKVWADGTSEPAGWTLTASDAEPALQQSLAVGLRALLGSGATVGPVFRFDDLAVRVLEGTPAADFTVSSTAGSAPLTVFFDDTSAGGTTSWAWDFGDGTQGSGPNPTHTYAAPGTYTVALTVANATGSDTETKTGYVVVDDDDAYLARDRFERTASNGWGSADIGGSYTVSTPADASVADGQGILSPASLNALRSARLLGVEAGDVEVLVRVEADQLAAGNSQSAYLELRHPGANDGYRLRLSLEPGGSVLLWWQKVVAGSTSSVSGLHTVTREQRVSAEDGFWIRAQAEGSNPTTLRARAWQDGTPEPLGWDVTGSDSSASLQAPNAIGLRALLGTGTTNAPVQVRFDELSAVELVGGSGLMAQAAGSGPDGEGLLLDALGAKVASRCVEYGEGAVLPADWQARADAIAARRTSTGWLLNGTAWVGDLASATSAFGGSRVAERDGHAWLLRKSGPTWFGTELRQELTARGTSVWTLDDPIHVLPAGECR